MGIVLKILLHTRLILSQSNVNISTRDIDGYKNRIYIFLCHEQSKEGPICINLFEGILCLFDELSFEGDEKL